MKRTSGFTILAFLFCNNPLAVLVRGIDNDGIKQLLDAIAQVESGNNSNSIGDVGQAIGMYQLHRSYPPIIL